MTAMQTNQLKLRSRWSLAAIEHVLRKHVARKPPRLLQSVAAQSWEIAPAKYSIAPPAFALPGQLERVTGWAFSEEHPRRQMQGGRVAHGATRGFLLKDVWLIDGALYKHGAHSWLAPRTSNLPKIRVGCEIARGAVYCSVPGYKYFGQWLMDDCVTYALAKEEGIPVTTAQPVSQHVADYEALLGMRPARLHNAYFREMVLFEDLSQNESKHLRFRAMSQRLLDYITVIPHPGVFILRGTSGEPRLLHNEMQLAEYLRVRRGFSIIDPAKSDVARLVATCAGARTVVGVEGSGLMHGILLLPPGGSVLTLQPPNRFVGMYKFMTDRDHQHFAYVVGQPQGDGFYINPAEVERTLDLLPR